jgi:hypothetical protein
MEMSDQVHAPAALSPRKKPGIRCKESWVGPRACVDILENRITSRPCRQLNPGRLAHITNISVSICRIISEQ